MPYRPPVRPKFSLGQVVATPGALSALERSGESPTRFLSRHVLGDWGEVCESDRRANDHAVRRRLRLLSVYSTRRGTKIWIITEADRSSTCILLPSEY